MGDYLTHSTVAPCRRFCKLAVFVVKLDGQPVKLKAQKAAAAAPAEAAAPAVELDEKAKKALAAAEATGDPEKVAKVKAALEKAAKLKAQKAAGNA